MELYDSKQNHFYQNSNTAGEEYLDGLSKITTYNLKVVIRETGPNRIPSGRGKGAMVYPTRSALMVGTGSFLSMILR
jgi:hypothetical protein